MLSLKITPHLKCVVTQWGKLSQPFTDRAIGQWRSRLEQRRRTNWTFDV